MGWTIGWNSRKSLENYICKNEEHNGIKHTILAKKYSGNNLWSVWEVERDGHETYRYIRLDLIKRWGAPGNRGGGWEWGHKDMDESCGPNEVTCPLKFLDMVPDPGWKWDGEPWRDRVRAYHASRKRPANLRVGDVYEVKGLKAKTITIRQIKGKTILGTLDDGMWKMYRIPMKYIGGGTFLRNENDMPTQQTSLF